MGEEIGGATVNIDMTGVVNELSNVSKALSKDVKQMIKEIAIQLYANSDFEHTSKSAAQLADASIERAKILAIKLEEI